jgi:hypothetical protein
MARLNMAEWANAESLAGKLTDAGLELHEAQEWVNEILAAAWDEGAKAYVKSRFVQGESLPPNPYKFSEEKS